jgi:O-antigen ligase
MPRSVPVLGRIVPADIVSLLVIISGFLGYIYKIRVNWRLWSFLAVIVLFSFGVLASKNAFGTLIEVIILLFLWSFAVITIDLIDSRKKFYKLLNLIILSAFFTSVICLWDLTTAFTGLPQIVGRTLESRIPAGTFKNSGQQGAFLLAFIAVEFSILFSSLSKHFSNKRLVFIKMTTFITLVCIIFNMKVASLLGLAVSVLLIIILKRRFSYLFYLSVIAIFIFQAFTHLSKNENRITKRMIYKYNTRVASAYGDYDNSVGSEWMRSNYGAALKAFKQNPILGSGIGGFASLYHKSEVHNTPLKLLGETGIVGTIGALIFIFSLLTLFSQSKKKNDFTNFLRLFSIMMIGCSVNWIYTYPFRKRFFWILIIVAFTAYRLSKQGHSQLKAR